MHMESEPGLAAYPLLARCWPAARGSSKNSLTCCTCSGSVKPYTSNGTVPALATHVCCELTHAGTRRYSVLACLRVL